MVGAASCWSERKATLTRQDVIDRAEEVLRWQVANGVLHVRSHVDVTDPAMGGYNAAYSFKLERIMSRSGVNMVSNPMVNLHLQGRFDDYPKRRGLTRVKEMLAAGVNVAFGHDDVMDPWYPLGTGNPAQVALVGRTRRS